MALIGNLQLLNGSVTPPKTDKNAYYSFAGLTATTAFVVTDGGADTTVTPLGLFTAYSTNDICSVFKSTAADGDIDIYLNNDVDNNWALSLKGSNNDSLQITNTTLPSQAVHPVATFSTIGQMGIGTNTPDSSAIVDIVTNTSSSGSLRVYNATDNVAVILKAGTGEAVLETTSNTALKINANSTQGIDIGTDGHVGIASNSNALYELTVGGDLNFTGTLYNNGTPAAFSNWTNNSTYIYRDSEVGIGSGFGSLTPAAKLEIRNLAGGDQNLLRLSADVFSGGSPAAAVLQYGLSDSSVTRSVAAEIKVGNDGNWNYSTASTVDAYMSFETIVDNVLAERMRINEVGDLEVVSQIGIGDFSSTDPAAKLHIKGDNYSPTSGGVATNGLIFRGGTDGDGTYTNGLSFSYGAGSSAISGLQVGADNDTMGMAFFTHPSGTGTDDAVEAARIEPLGTIVVGGCHNTTTPREAVVVAPYGEGTDIAGADLSFYGGRSTGTGTGGCIKFFVSPAGGSTGTGVNAAAQKMTINSAGQVGINNDTPTVILDVKKDSTSAYVTNTDQRGLANIAIRNIDETAASFSSFSFVSGSGNQSEWSINNVYESQYAGNLAFKTRIGATTWAEAMRLDYAGRLTIGNGTVGTSSGSCANLLYAYSQNIDNSSARSTIRFETSYPDPTGTPGAVTCYCRNMMVIDKVACLTSGFVDTGYRVGLQIENYKNSSSFVGVLDENIALWARSGAYTGATGTICCAFAAKLEILNTGNATVNNSFGVYQSVNIADGATLASVDARNYFQSKIVQGSLATNDTACLSISASSSGPESSEWLARFRGGTNSPTTNRYILIQNQFTGACYDANPIVWQTNANSDNCQTVVAIRPTSDGQIKFRSCCANAAGLAIGNDVDSCTADRMVIHQNGALSVCGGILYLGGLGGTASNATINNAGSVRINIDSDNNSTGEFFEIGHNQCTIDANNKLMCIDESGNMCISGNIDVAGSFLSGGAGTQGFWTASGNDIYNANTGTVCICNNVKVMTPGVVYTCTCTVSNANIVDILICAAEFSILEVYSWGNGNTAGSSDYRDLAHFYIYNGGGFDGANVINIINTQHLAPVARDIYPNAGVGTADGSIVEANWYNGTTDSDCITVATATSNCIRLCYCCLGTSNTQICVSVTRRL